MTRLVDTATLEHTSWDFLVQDEHENWRHSMVEEVYTEAEQGVQLPVSWDPDPELMAAMRRKTDRVARKYEVSAEDLFTDTILHMAVRPQRVSVEGVNDAVGVLAYRAEQVALSLAKPMASAKAREESLEALLSAGDDQWPL